MRFCWNLRLWRCSFACISCVDLLGNQKKCLAVYQALDSTSICMASLVLSCRKNPGKIGIFGDVPCLILQLVGVAQKTAFVNFRKWIFLKWFLQNLRGCAHIMLCFPVKSEIGQNFRVYLAGLVSVICREMVLCGPICSGPGSWRRTRWDNYQVGNRLPSKTKKHTPKSNSKKKRETIRAQKAPPPKKATQKDKTDGLPLKMKNKVTK